MSEVTKRHKRYKCLQYERESDGEREKKREKDREREREREIKRERERNTETKRIKCRGKISKHTLRKRQDC